MLTAEDLKSLAAPFDETIVGVKPSRVSGGYAYLVLYLSHTDVANRLDAVDPSWGSAITDEREPAAGFFSARCCVTVNGVSRENVGEGSDPKSAASDALKRAAMLFGVGRYLYDSEDSRVPYTDADKYRVWTYADYKRGLRVQPARPAVPAVPAAKAGPVVAPRAAEGKPPAGRVEIGMQIDRCIAQLGLGTEYVAEWVNDLYGKPLNRLTLVEMEGFYGLIGAEVIAKNQQRNA